LHVFIIYFRSTINCITWEQALVLHVIEIVYFGNGQWAHGGVAKILHK